MPVLHGDIFRAVETGKTNQLTSYLKRVMSTKCYLDQGRGGLIIVFADRTVPSARTVIGTSMARVSTGRESEW